LRTSASRFSRAAFSAIHRRFKLLHERNGIGRRRFGVHINKIAQMEKARDTVPVALLSRLSEIDIGRLVWLKKRRHLPLRRAWSRRHANRLPVIFP
jgi:hypothetical protein